MRTMHVCLADRKNDALCPADRKAVNWEITCKKAV